MAQPQTNPSLLLEERDAIPVQHEELSISMVEFVQPVNDHYILLHRNPDGISVINPQGELITRLGRSGRGPFEWLSPREVHFLDGRVWIWDASGAKFLVFNQDFQPVEEIVGVEPGSNRFHVHKENRNVATLQVSRNQSEFVKYYNREENGEFSLAGSFGRLSPEGRRLFFMLHAGGIL